MKRPRRPDPRPIETNDVIVFAAGTGVWMIALVVLLVRRSSIDPSYHWWAWVCVAAIVGGLFGIVLGPRIKRRGISRSRRADGSLQAPATTAAPDTGSHAAGVADGDESAPGGTR